MCCSFVLDSIYRGTRSHKPIVNDDEIEYPKRIKLATDLQSLPSTSPERSKILWALRLRRVDRRVRFVLCLLWIRRRNGICVVINRALFDSFNDSFIEISDATSNCPCDWTTRKTKRSSKPHDPTCWATTDRLYVFVCSVCCVDDLHESLFHRLRRVLCGKLLAESGEVHADWYAHDWVAAWEYSCREGGRKGVRGREKWLECAMCWRSWTIWIRGTAGKWWSLEGVELFV